MSRFLDSRKRSREEDSESTPLSKRINRLHINYEDAQWNDNSSSSSCSTMAAISNETTTVNTSTNHNNTNSNTSSSCSNNNNANVNGNCNNINNNNNNKHAHIIVNGGGLGVVGANVNTTGIETELVREQTNLYNPELTEDDNPFYYIKNKLLHDLHIERLKRASH